MFESLARQDSIPSGESRNIESSNKREDPASWYLRCSATTLLADEIAESHLRQVQHGLDHQLPPAFGYRFRCPGDEQLRLLVYRHFELTLRPRVQQDGNKEICSFDFLSLEQGFQTVGNKDARLRRPNEVPGTQWLPKDRRH